MRHLLAALLLAGSIAAAAADGIELDTQVVYYDVAGATAQEVLDDMRHESRAAGLEYFGFARWNVRWAYDYDRAVRGACGIRNLRVRLTQKTTLPRWQDPRAPAALAAQWDAYIAALRAHEDGHHEHGRRAAAEIRAVLPGLRATDCERLEAAADALGESIIARYAAMDPRYDADTEHGTRQGAYWSVPRPRPVPASAPRP